MPPQFVVFGVPSFQGKPEREFVLSIMETQAALANAGIGYSMTLLAGDPYLGKVRNRIASQFLLSTPHATDLFWLDDDIGWDPDAVVRLLQRPEDVICGVYPQKKDALSFPVTLELAPDGQMIEKDGLYLAQLAPTGFMRIKRHVLEQMAQKVGKYYETDIYGERLLQFNIFEARYVDTDMEALRKTDLEDLTREEAIAHLRRSLGLVVSSDIGGWWGEDYWFTERWREMGGKVWVDPEIRFTHRGSKAWGATFGDSIRATLAKMKEAA
ncbi:MAG TPA: hypothetical protein VNU68_35055 [Verrucomicrobiae bacterium]|nr:hypothetical protein [Verrucomicrobiae bacterium]